MNRIETASRDLERIKSRMPPPLPCLIGVLAGVGIDLWLPWSIGPRPVTIGAGVWLAAATGRASRDHATPVDPARETLAIVETGPFRFTRNPAYLAACLLQAAIGCFLDNAWVLVFIIPALIAIQQLVVLREEAYLEAKFGEAYLSYKARVRRWL